MVETSQLQTLVSVAQTQSFSKAAEELHVTQSAISQSIKNLEAKLGVSIFKRSGKRVILTLEGEKLYNVAKKYLMGIDDVIQDIQNSRNELTGGVRLGSLSGVAKTWIFPLALEFSKEFPDIFLSYRVATTPQELVDEFERYLLDCIIVPENDIPAAGEKHFLVEEYVTLVYPKNPSFRISREMDVDSFSKLPLVLFERDDTLFRHYCRKLYGAVPHRFNKRLAVNSHTSMMQAVAEGIGVAVVPTHVFERSMYQDKVATFGKDFEVLYKSFYLVHHKETKELKRVQVLVEKILRYYQENKKN